MRPANLPVWVGIDLGTTYSSLAFINARYTQKDTLQKECIIATDRSGSRPERQFIPSDVCVYYENGEIKWAFGEEAFKLAHQYGNAAHLYRRGYKLKIGEKFSESNEVVLQEKNGKSITLNFTPAEIAQKLVEHLRILADREYLEGREIEGISVSVPALWSPDRKKAVEDLVQAAGFGNSVEIEAIEEPLAALYYHIDNYEWLFRGSESHVMVIDYGGGTCNVAVVKIYQDAEERLMNKQSIGEVVGRGSIAEGGLVIDRLICGLLSQDISGFDEMEEAWQMQEAEKLKIDFANQMSDIGFPLVMDLELKHDIEFPDHSHHDVKITIGKFWEKVGSQIARLEDPVNQSIQNTRIEVGLKEEEFGLQDIRMVFLTGGTTLLPFVKQAVYTLFKSTNRIIDIEDGSPRQAIVFGAAKHAFHSQTQLGPGFNVVLKDNIYLGGNFGLGHLIAPKGTRLPHKEKYIFDRLGWFNYLDIKFYKGKSAILSSNQSIDTNEVNGSAPIGQQWKLKKHRVHARVEVEVAIRISGTLHVKMMINGETPFVINRDVPVQSDVKAMEERSLE